jgi:hypothetical protein
MAIKAYRLDRVAEAVSSIIDDRCQSDWKVELDLAAIRATQRDPRDRPPLTALPQPDRVSRDGVAGELIEHLDSHAFVLTPGTRELVPFQNTCGSEPVGIWLRKEGCDHALAALGYSAVDLTPDEIEGRLLDTPPIWAEQLFNPSFHETLLRQAAWPSTLRSARIELDDDTRLAAEVAVGVMKELASRVKVTRFNKTGAPVREEINRKSISKLIPDEYEKRGTTLRKGPDPKYGVSNDRSYRKASRYINALITRFEVKVGHII